MSAEYTAGRTALRTAAIMTVFTLVLTAVMAFTHDVTAPLIQASVRDEKLRLINELLPAERYDNALVDDVLKLGPTPALGMEDGAHVYRARKAGAPVAVVLEAAAPDGYGGRIDLIIAVGADGVLQGVRVTAHRETPGLGDYVDRRKDKRKDAPWIDQFSGLAIDTVDPATGWTVRKDGGHFDFHTGATISARAVSKAVGRAVAFVGQQGEHLYSPVEARP